MKVRVFGDGKDSYYLDHRKIKSLKRKCKGLKYINEFIKQGKKGKK
jgi:hypothetical protein